MTQKREAAGKSTGGRFAKDTSGAKNIPTTALPTPVPTSADTSTAPAYDKLYDAIPKRYTDRGDSGRHPVYGGLNWGVHYSEYWQDYQVNHGYYGSSDHVNGQDFIDNEPVPADVVRWTCDQKNETTAVLVWQHRDLITQKLHELGFSVRKGVRVSVKPDPETRTMTVAPYDYPKDFVPFTIPLLP